MDSIEFFFLLFLSIGWGSSYIIGSLLLRTLDPITMQLFRCAGSCLILFTVCLTRIAAESVNGIQYDKSTSFTAKALDAFSKQNRWRTIHDCSVVGLLFHIVGGLCVFYSQRVISGGLESVIFSFESIFAALILFAAGKIEKSYFTRPLILGVILSMLGVCLVSFPELSSSSQSASPMEKVLFLSLSFVSVLGYAAGAAFNKILTDTHQVDSLILVTGQFTVGLVATLFISTLRHFAFDGHDFMSLFTFLADIRANVWISFALWCVICNVGCFYLFIWLIQRIGAKASLYALLVPCISMALGIVFLGQWSGMALGMKLVQSGGLFVVIVGLFIVIREEMNHSKERVMVIDIEQPVAFVVPEESPTESPQVPLITAVLINTMVDYGAFYDNASPMDRFIPPTQPMVSVA